MSTKADEVIKKRRNEYIRDTFILILVLALVATGVALAVKFLRKEPASIVLYSETGEIIGTYSESNSVTIPSKNGYTASWVTDEGKEYETVKEALDSGETSIKQLFTPIEYSITLYLTGGALSSDFGYEFHEADEDNQELGDYYTKVFTVEDEAFDLPAIKTKNVATKHGMTFEFWSSVNYLGKNYPIDSLKATEVKTVDPQNAQDVVLYAAWKDIISTVGVVGFEGDVLFFETHTVNTILDEETLTNNVKQFTPDGFMFIGFYSDKNLTKPFDFTKELALEQVTIFTKWHSPEFNLVFKDLNGDVLLSSVYRMNDTIIYYDYTDKLTPGKDFDCWTFNDVPFNTTIMPAEDIELYPRLVNIPYTITWYVTEDRQLSETYYYDDVPEAPATFDVSKEETESHTFEFAGWSPTIEPVSGDATYTATYTPIVKQFTYSISAHDTVLVDETTVDYDTAIIFPADPDSYMEGNYEYVFDKWVIKDTDVTPTTVTKDMVIVASYTQLPRPYSVKWVDKDGNTLQVDNGEGLVDSITIRYGSTADLSLGYSDGISTYTKEIYTRNRTFTFVGWTIDDVLQTSNEYTVVGETVIVATYADLNPKSNIEINYTDGTKDLVEYYVGDADLIFTLIMALDDEKDADETYEYSFDTWYIDNNGVTTELTEYSQLDVEANETIVLVPNFNRTYINYTVKFVDYDGTQISSETYHYGDSVTAPADPTRAANNTYEYSFTGWDSDVVDCDGNKTYTAVYNETYIEYTITFVDYDDSVISTANYHYGDTVVVPDDPTRDADVRYTYAFKDWGETVVAVNGDKTYKATYTETYIEYEIIWDGDNGDEPIVQYYHYADSITAPITPTKPADNTYHYSFDGWTPDIGIVEGNQTYTATYTPIYNEYTITFVNYDDSVILSTSTYHYGDEVVLPASNPTRPADETYTYTFTGWDNEVINVADDATYKATYTSTYIDYTIRFVNYDNTELSSTTYHYGATVTPPDDPTREQSVSTVYTFAGWDSEVVNVAGNKTYTATYSTSPRKYTYTFYLDDHTTVFESGTADYGTKVHKPTTNPTKQADATYTYDFAKWTTFDGTDYVDEQDLVGDVSYMATFTPSYINYTVKFVDYDGTELSKLTTCHYGDAVTSPANPTRDADETYTYEFAGWDDEVVNVVGDATYTATYTSTYIEYTITWVLNNGEDDIVQNYHYNETVTPPADPTKPADETYTYTFASWDKEIVACTGNKTYTATYTEDFIDYTVKFVDYDGTQILSETYHYGDSVTTPDDPDRAADKTYTYSFAGWDSTVVACDGNKTYTATYTPSFIDYMITWVLNNGQEDIVHTYHYNDTITIPANPTRPDYNFTGWDDSIPEQMPDENLYITAQWELTPYYVFAYIGNDIVAQYKFDIENDVELAAYVNEAYDFGGWYRENINNAETTTFTPITSYGHASGSINVYGVIKTKGVTIENNTVTAYNGSATHVVIPRIWKTDTTIYEITTIGVDAFTNTDIESIDMPFITIIAESAFNFCISLTAIDLSNVESIGNYAFTDCGNITNVDLSNVKVIGNYAFNECEGITSVDLSNATSIGEKAFKSSGVTAVVLSDNLVSLGDYAFYKCSIESVSYTGDTNNFETLVNSTKGNSNLLI